MDTLRSNKKWYCSLLIFSGRPNPLWFPKESIVEQLLSFAECVTISNTSFELPSILGYRGVVLVSKAISITAFKGLLYITRGNETETRIDLNQAFEKLILNNLPAKYKHLPFGE
ncbi:MAG: hypothetical protein IPN10_03770 [Saprospiraceae bacterium]|nr:hypothetical protein [Saprospiraceae bacterium]